MHLALLTRARDFHPLDYAHAGRTSENNSITIELLSLDFNEVIL